MTTIMPLNKRYFRLVANNIILALIYGTVWWPLLWLSGHPLEEWAVTVTVLYISLWVFKEVIVNLLAFASRRLTERERRIADHESVELVESQPVQLSIRERLLLLVLTSMLFSTVIGASLSAGIPALAWFGLTPLIPFFNWIGWALLGIGAFGLSLFLASFWRTRTTIDNRGISRIQAVTSKAIAFAGPSATY